MNLLLLSNSTNHGEQYMQWCSDTIADFVKNKSSIVFIPYAAVGFSYQDYTDKVNEALSSFDIKVRNIDDFDDKIKALKESTAVFIGGGNTFHLLKMLQNLNLINTIHELVLGGLTYVGWSAGSNIASPTICTTNDMPIVQPESFDSLCLIPFQINPHYTEDTIPNHGGESRLQRLSEYIAANPTEKIVALPESSYLTVIDRECRYFGNYDGKLISDERNEIIKNQSIVIF
ncbi:MAG: dipeptidase PepE [Bacteroidia bacterium]|nr:dipeptidase PepE [Bacteroidia bacterium]